MTTKVIEFRRVSTEEQGSDDKAGLPRQKEANAATIKRHKLTVVEVIELSDVSGTEVMRTREMKRLLELIKSDDIRGVVVSDQDRLFGPDNFHHYGLLQDFIDTNTLLYLPDGPLDIKTQSGYVLAAIQAVFSGNELRQIKKRMLEGKEIKRKNGEHPKSAITLPTGVDYDRETKRFSYNEETTRINHLFELFETELAPLNRRHNATAECHCRA